jgi:Putative binding domain, N-terminal
VDRDRRDCKWDRKRPVELTFAANTGPARTGTVTVAGRTVTVAQENGCTFTVNPTSQTVPAPGGVGSVAVGTSGGCTWTAVSGVPWITITDGGSGSGGGNVQFAVEPNATGAPRAGTLTIATVVFTLNQQ